MAQRGSKRTAADRERDYELIARLLVQRKTQQQIADRVAARGPYTLTPQQIGQDIKVIKKRWQESALVNTDEARTEELEGLYAVKAELWSAWERSLRESRDGDPRFLAQIASVSERISKLLGLDRPQRHEFSGADGQPLVLTFVAAEKPDDAGA